MYLPLAAGPPLHQLSQASSHLLRSCKCKDPDSRWANGGKWYWLHMHGQYLACTEMET